MGDESAIRTMLQRFAQAFTSGDGAGAAACWEVPALVVSDDGGRAISALPEIAGLFAGAREQYSRQGVTGTRVDVLGMVWHTERVASVTVRWPLLDAQGKEVSRTEPSVYVVRVTDGAAKICAAIMTATR